MRLIYLSGSKPKNEINFSDQPKKNQDDEIKMTSKLKKVETINQIKNVAQEIKAKPELQTDSKADKKISINSFNDLIEICNSKKEMKLKYELENNINLVKFENQRIEISFNDNLDKDFVKDLSTKLFEWTNNRWIISFSKIKGELSIKDKEKNKQKEIIEKSKKSDLYKSVLDFDSRGEYAVSAAYSIGYHYDQGAKIDSAMKYYQWIKDNHPKTDQSIQAELRLNTLNIVLSTINSDTTILNIEE